MKLTRYPKNPILKPNPKIKWEAGATFNPSVIYDKGEFHLLYRAITSGFKRKPDGSGYINWTSSIGYAKSKDGIHFEKKKIPFIKPNRPFDRFGCEDPRITKFEDTYYIFYTGMPRPAYTQNEIPGIALATTKDFKKIKKYGLIGPDPIKTRVKAAALFPEKIRGKIRMLFTWHPDKPDSTICYTEFKTHKELTHPPKYYWHKILSQLDYHVVIGPPKNSRRGPELGAPPIKTKEGWLLIYCGPAIKEKIWLIHAALLDLKNPQKVLWQSNGPILKPEKLYEKKGMVNNVTFPEGAVLKNEKLMVYYGAGDKYCCLATSEFKNAFLS